MSVLWTAEALTEVEAIVEYIAADNPGAAIALSSQIFDSVETLLSDHPQAGRPGRVAGTRELVVHASYVVAYRITNEGLQILTVRHTARLWPEAF